MSSTLSPFSNCGGSIIRLSGRLGGSAGALLRRRQSPSNKSTRGVEERGGSAAAVAARGTSHPNGERPGWRLLRRATSALAKVKLLLDLLLVGRRLSGSISAVTDELEHGVGGV